MTAAAYSAATAFAVTFTLLAVGRRAIEAFGLKIGGPSARAIFSFAVGYGLMAHVFFALGVVGLYTKAVGWIIFGAAVFLSRGTLKNLYDDILSAAAGLRAAVGASPATAFAALFFILLTALLSLAPPHFYDSLVYHLALPSEYIKQNSIRALPNNLFSHFPQNAEMIFLFALLLGDGVTANLLTFFTSVFALGAVYIFTRDRFGASAAALSVFILSSSTFFMLLASCTYVEIHLAFMLFAAFWLFAEYAERDDERLLAAAGVLSGFAVGIKYTGFAGLFALNVILLSHSFFRRAAVSAVLRRLFALNAAAFAASAVWFIKNAVYAGNPVFPFFYRIFGYKNVGWTDAAAAGYFAMLTEYSHKSSIFFELLALPYNMIFNPIKFGGGMDVLGDLGWTLFLAATPVAIFFLKKNSALRRLFVYSALFFAVWFATKPVLRFFVPAALPLAVISGVVINQIYRRLPSIPRMFVVAAVLAASLSNLRYFLFVTSFFNPARVIIGSESREAYLIRTLKNSPVAAFGYINREAAPDGRIFFVGEQRLYYCSAFAAASNVFAPNPLIAWADAAVSADELLETIRLKNFTHIFYNIPEGERLAPYGIFDFSAKGKKNWNELLYNLLPRAVYYDGACIIYDVRPAAG